MKLTLEELDEIFKEMLKNAESNPLYSEPYRDGVIRGIVHFRTVIGIREGMKPETKQGTIQDVLKNCDCDFQVEAREPCKERQSVTITFNGVGFIYRTVDFTLEIE